MPPAGYPAFLQYLQSGRVSTFPFRDTASFVDMETGERLQVDPAYVRDEYRRQLDAFIDR